MKGQGVVEYSILLFLVAIVLIVFLALIGPAYQQVMANVVEAPPEAPPVPEFPETLADLPLTNHAEGGHVNDVYNARNLPDMFDRGQCRSYSVAYCAHDMAFHVVCEVKEGFYAGIIVGVACEVPVIVTAYPASYAYWMKNTSGCVDVTFPPAGLALP